MNRFLWIIIMIGVAVPGQSFSQQFEFCNNFLMNLSFVTGTDRGMLQNLDDNCRWMRDQGYSHLRFFGIFPNGVHCFPSPTLDANGYPRSAYHEQVLGLLVTKAQQYGIVVNFDGWEVIAETNRDTTKLGVGFITAQELGSIVQEVLSLGIKLISEEQFGNGYLQTIQSVCAQLGASHETTAMLWWQYSWASSIADMQLDNAFCFYPYGQEEADSLISAGHGYDLAANLGTLHLTLESCKYFGIPISVAVGSFGTIRTENWKNVLLFTQLQHLPDRFSIEDSNTGFLIWNPSFNFMDYVGTEVRSLVVNAIGERPVANLIFDASWIYTPSFIPTWYTALIDAAAIVNTFTSQGYRVVATVDSVLQNAQAYYILLAGGPYYPYIASLPEYVVPLLGGSKPVFVHPTYGIPDGNDAASWTPLRDFFGLPSGETETIPNAIPEYVVFNDFTTKWGGITLYLTPCLEYLPQTQIDTAYARVVLSGTVAREEVALIIQNGNKYLVNSNLISIEASYVLSDLLAGPLRGPSASDVVIVDDKALIFAEYNTDVDIDLPWSGLTHIMRWDSQGNTSIDRDTMLLGRFSSSLLRGEFIFLQNTYDFICGDANSDGNITVGDAVYLINYLFRGGTAPTPLESGDANSDGEVSITDVVYLINYLFKGGPQPCEL